MPTKKSNKTLPNPSTHFNGQIPTNTNQPTEPIEHPETHKPPKCPQCNTRRHIVRSGIRHSKRKDTQRYLCKKCLKIFTTEPLTRTSYPPEIIITAISTYNLGNSLSQTTQIINRKFKLKLLPPTILYWLKKYRTICTFTGTLRKKFSIDPQNIILSKKFHHQQVYDYKYHTLKTNIAGKTFPQIKFYSTSIIKKRNFIPTKPFQHGPRCSELRIDNKPEKTTKHNNAPKLAQLAQTLAKTNRERHQHVENTFLINDSATIAIEVPVYMTPDELSKDERTTFGSVIKEPLSGHIDILQVRFNKIHILDYKPEISQTEKAAVEQLFLYALALAKRIKIPLYKFSCAYFNEDSYYQFSPSLD
jgi:transposase-like protein